MTTRTSKRTVTFKNPFALVGWDELQPAGIYHVETDEERLEGISFPAYRRTATWIRLHENPGRPGVVQILKIDPEELDAALAGDAASAGARTIVRPEPGCATQSRSTTFPEDRKHYG